MGRASVKENKTAFQLAREELDLTRESASELLEYISADRLEKIENGRSYPRPDEVLTMAEKYKSAMARDWAEIYQIVKENCATDYSAGNPHTDMMENLFKQKSL